MRSWALASVIASTAAWAGPPVVLFEAKVAQFKEAASIAKAQLNGAVEVDLADAAALEQLPTSPVIVAVGQKALTLAKERAPSTPIVFCLALGVSKEQLSATVTGIPFEPDPESTLARLKEVAPGKTKIGVLYNPASSDWLVTEAQRAAKASSLTLIARPVASPQEARDAARTLLPQVDLLWLPPDARLFPKDLVLFFLTAAAERSTPVVGFLDSMAQVGALATVSTDVAEGAKRAGRLAAEIVAKPEGRRTPVPPPTWAPGKLTLNLKTAESLKIKPTPAAEAAASQLLR